MRAIIRWSSYIRMAAEQKKICREKRGQLLREREEKESERVPSRKQEKYKCSIFLRE
jgi:hypothetical protein